MNLKKRSRKVITQRGQALIEYVLLLVVVLALSTVVKNLIRQASPLESLVVKPWDRIDGMIQCGVWMECGITKQVPQLHPDSHQRVITIRLQ